MTLWHLEVCAGMAPKPAEVNEHKIKKKKIKKRRIYAFSLQP